MDSTPTPQVYRLLLVDDHQMILDGLAGMLANVKNYHISGTANDGTEAMALIDANPDNFDIIITDISMPLLSGIELCKMVKTAHPRLLVLILSMHSASVAVQESIMAEADGYLLKSSGRDQLLKALNRIVDGGTYYSEDILPIIYKQYKKDRAHDEEKQKLSTREHEILKLIMAEKTSEEIGKILFISKKTVENHRSKIMDKTACGSTVGLVKWAIENDLSE